MKEDVPDYEMFQPGQVYDDSFDDENDTVALIDDDYIGLGFLYWYRHRNSGTLD